MASLLIVEDNYELGALLQAALEARGHSTTVVHTGKEGIEAAQQRRYDLAIVDLLLPDLPGAEVLLELRKLGTRFVVMSGVYKGSRFAQEARETHGAIAFFEKPFPFSDLTLCIEAITGPADVLKEEPHDLEDVTFEVVVEPGFEEPSGLPSLAEWERIWRRPAGAPRPPRPELPRSGSLKTTSVPRLLNAFWQAKHSGELVLHKAPAIKVVAFEAGRPVYAASNLAHERFARFCARRGLLRDDDLEAVAQLAREEGLRTGVAMVRLGVLTEAQRVELLNQQIREIIWSTFAWAEGDYTITRGKPLKGDLAKLEVFPGELILEGIAREPLVALRARLPAGRRLFPSADPPYLLESFKFSDQQASLIAATDGTKTVEDLLALSDLSEREALGLLAGLEQVGFLEERKERPRRVSFAF